MFLTGDIPEEKTELAIIETQPKKSLDERMIDTNYKQNIRGEEVKAQVLDEFMDVLFPKKKKNKYEIAHEKFLIRQKLDDEKEEKEARKRILYLANNQYDDDPEESVVLHNMQQELSALGPNP